MHGFELKESDKIQNSRISENIDGNMIYNVVEILTFVPVPEED